jgi:hypothetical protein
LTNFLTQLFELHVLQTAPQTNRQQLADGGPPITNFTIFINLIESVCARTTAVALHKGKYDITRSQNTTSFTHHSHNTPHTNHINSVVVDKNNNNNNNNNNNTM